MNIYPDTMAEALGMVPLEQKLLKQLYTQTPPKNSIYTYGGGYQGEEHPMYGRTHTKETREILSEKGMGNTNKLGKKHSKEALKKHSAAMLKRYEEGYVNPMENPKFRDKIRQAQHRNKKPCPKCGWEMNPGNLSRHILKCSP